MKLALLLSFCAFAVALRAADAVQAETLPVLAAPDFKSPLDATWKIAQGSYEPRDGVLVCAEKPENKHVAVLWHQAGWNTGVIECEFRLDGSKSFIVGCDGKTPDGVKHVGRFSLSPKQISIAEDSVKPSHILVRQTADLASGVWHKLRIEWTGDQISVKINEQTLQARHPFLAMPKTRSWIAVGGQTASVRALKISGKP